MSAFVWTLTAINTAVAAMALFNAASGDSERGRWVAAGGVLFHGATAAWGWSILL